MNDTKNVKLVVKTVKMITADGTVSYEKESLEELLENVHRCGENGFRTSIPDKGKIIFTSADKKMSDTYVVTFRSGYENGLTGIMSANDGENIDDAIEDDEIPYEITSACIKIGEQEATIAFEINLPGTSIPEMVHCLKERWSSLGLEGALNMEDTEDVDPRDDLCNARRINSVMMRLSTGDVQDLLPAGLRGKRSLNGEVSLEYRNDTKTSISVGDGIKIWDEMKKGGKKVVMNITDSNRVRRDIRNDCKEKKETYKVERDEHGKPNKEEVVGHLIDLVNDRKN